MEIQNNVKNWDQIELGKVCKVQGGFAFKSGDFIKAGIPVVKIGEIQNGFISFSKRTDYIDETFINKYGLGKYVLKKNDILIAMTGATTGKIGRFTNGRALLNQRVGKLEPNEDIDNDFLYFLTQTDQFYKSVIGNILASAQGNISPSKLEELKRSVMQHLFAHGTKGEKTKLTEIGEMPESWNMVELKSLVPNIEYGVSQAIPKNKPEHGYKIVSTADITKSGNFLYDQLRYIEVTRAQAQKLRLLDGDVLFNWRNSLDHIGKTTIYKDRGEHVIFASFILCLRCDEKKAHNRFIRDLMNYYRDKDVFSKLARRAVNQANYNRNEIYVLQVPSPSYSEQVEITEIIERVEDKIKATQAKLALYQELFKTLLYELMSGERKITYKYDKN